MKLFLLLTVVILEALSGEALAAPFWRRQKPHPECQVFLNPPQKPEPLPENENLNTIEALKVLHENIPIILRDPALQKARLPWAPTLDGYLWRYVRSESKHLSIGIFGPGNSGKSTLFNSLIRAYHATLDVNQTQPLPVLEISKTDLIAGRTARPVLMVHQDLIRVLHTLEERFGKFDIWQESEQSISPGAPVAYPVEHFFRNLIFIDTPSFDIRETRGLADRIFQQVDIIFYVFSDANYKNEANLIYLRQKLNEVGPRHVALIYRGGNTIDPETAQKIFEDVAKEIFPKAEVDNSTGLPNWIAGTYLMKEGEISEAGSLPAELMAIGHSPQFPALLSDLDARHEHFRKQALNASLDYILDGISQLLHALQKSKEEILLTETAFELLLNEITAQVMGVSPYHRLTQEVERQWFDSRGGLRAVARWIGMPWRQLRREAQSQKLAEIAMQDITDYAKAVIDRVTKEFQIAVNTRKLHVHASSPGVMQYLEDLKEFRVAHGLQPAEAPYAINIDGLVEIHLSRNPDVTTKLNEYLNRNWQAIAQHVQNEARAKLQDLAMQIQSEMMQVAELQLRRRHISENVAQSLYQVMAVAPFFTALAYIAYSPSVNLLEYRGLLSVAGSMAIAHLMVNLDEASVREAWNKVINEWYGQRQNPRLIDILREHVRFRPSPALGPAASSAAERVQMASEILGRQQSALMSDERIPPL